MIEQQAVLLVIAFGLSCVFAKVELVDDPKEEQEEARNPGPSGPTGPGFQRPCPVCDSSVYSYCGDRLFHDSCCCNPYDQVPFQCRFADCSFLHANTCAEHRLITQCCCTNYLHYKR